MRHLFAFLFLCVSVFAQPTLTPANVAIKTPGQTVQFVTNAASPTWTLIDSSCILCGPVVGTISVTGLYTAPATFPPLVSGRTVTTVTVRVTDTTTHMTTSVALFLPPPIHPTGVIVSESDGSQKSLPVGVGLVIDNTSLRGQQGPPGPPGPTGATGSQGPPGPVGSPGQTGMTGLQGLPGPQGNDGPPGPQGQTGVNGNDGAPGMTGPQGVQGVQGDTGATGLPGPIGPQGIPGIPGPTGLQGVAGPQGPAGNDGAPGLVGPQGVPGIPGPTGMTGPTGLQGPQGPQGLVGMVGPSGPAGPVGPQGPPGSGPVPYVNVIALVQTNGTWTFQIPTTAGTLANVQVWRNGLLQRQASGTPPSNGDYTINGTTITPVSVTLPDGTVVSMWNTNDYVTVAFYFG